MKILYFELDDPRYRPPLGGPVLEGMPEGCVRLNPNAVQDITAFLMAIAQPLAKQAVMSIRGLKGVARKRAIGGRTGARRALSTIASLCARLEQLVDHRLVAKLCGALAEDEPRIQAEQAEQDRDNPGLPTGEGW